MIPNVSIIIPAYNEATRIGRTVRHRVERSSTRTTSAELLVVDDGSRRDGYGRGGISRETLPRALASPAVVGKSRQGLRGPAGSAGGARASGAVQRRRPVDANLRATEAGRFDLPTGTAIWRLDRGRSTVA